MFSKTIKQIFLINFMLLTISSFSQGNQMVTISTKKLHFSKVQLEPTYKIVEFYLNSSISDEQKNILEINFKNNPDIKYFEFLPDNLCVLKTDFQVSPEDILQILKLIDVDFQYKYVKYLSDKEISLENSPNKEEERIRAQKELQWRKNHPQEWQEKLNNRKE